MSEAEVRQHNRRQLWVDVENHLRVASEAIEQAQGSLEDLGLRVWADQLQPLRDALSGARQEAAEQAEAPDA